MSNKQNLTKSGQLPYSYHTFLFAFYIEGDIDFRKTVDEKWKKDSIRKGKDVYEDRLNYQAFQYFTPEARRLMFGSTEENDNYTIHRFIYDIEKIPDPSYTISKTLEEYKDNKPIRWFEEYRLSIDNIKATVFQNQIVILQFDLENHDPKHQDLDSVKRINEYGRRINLPYICEEGSVHSLVADSISILGKTVEYSSFGAKALGKFLSSDDNINIVPPVLELIYELLPKEQREKVKINPVIDDRMFVCCLVRDDKLTKKYKSIIKEDEDSIPIVGKDIYTDRVISNELYSFAFIDAKDSTCQSPEMREEILKRCIYSRWRDEGTIYAVTHHSLVCLTGEADFLKFSVINPFLTEYVIMASGVLLQRATLMRLSDKCSEISFRTDMNKKEQKELIDDIKCLKRDYVYAQNNIFLSQFTAQEQGIEIYDMMRNEMYINDSLKDLNNKVNGIYDYTTESAESEENELLNMLTRIGLPLAFMQVFSVILSFNFFSEKSSWQQIGGLGAIISICVFLAWFIFLMHNAYKSSSKKTLLRVIAIVSLMIFLALSLSFLICKSII